MGDSWGAWCVVRVGRRADRHLPNALRCLSGALFMGQDLLCQLNVGLGAARAQVVRKNRLAEAGGLCEANAARNYSAKDGLLKEFAKILFHLSGKVHPLVVHGEQYALNLDSATESLADTLNSIEELRNPFQREKLALDRDQDGIRSNHGVQS